LDVGVAHEHDVGFVFDFVGWHRDEGIANSKALSAL
jgi:hypothetical protein